LHGHGQTTAFPDGAFRRPNNRISGYGASSSFMVAGERLLSAGTRRFMGALSTSPPLCELDVLQAFRLAERKPKLRLPVSWEAPS
jgi:hypothetical protein